MSKIYCFLMLLLMCLSCSEELVVDVPDLDEEGEIVTVSFGVRSEQRNTRMWYDQNGQGKFDVKWSLGDRIKLIADSDFPLVSDKVGDFKVVEIGDRIVIEGEIENWSYDRRLTAVYPYREDISYSSKKLTHNVESQVVNAKIADGSSHGNTENAMSNSILLSKAEGAKFESDKLNVDYLHFKQAMSFLRFTLEDTKDDYELQQMWLWDTESSLITEAKIWVDYDEAARKDSVYCEAQERATIVTATFEKQEVGEQAIINFALFPTIMKDPKIGILAKDKNGKMHYFFKDLTDEPIEFKRNIFNYFGSVLDLDKSEDFTKVSNIYHLDSFTATSPIPEEDEWVILSNSVISASDLDHLNNKVAGAKDENGNDRMISLKFINLTWISGDNAFEKVNNLKSIELPHCKRIGDYTFWLCRDLTEVIMPALENAGNWTFDDNQEDVNYPLPQEVKFYAATNPGIMLEYGADGTAATTISSESVISRVHLYIGNKDKYGDKTKDNYIMMDIPWTLGERKQSFGSINWQ